MEDEVIHAEVTVRFRLPDFCSQSDLTDGVTLDELVRHTIEEEGWSILYDADHTAILDIRQWKS